MRTLTAASLPLGPLAGASIIVRRDETVDHSDPACVDAAPTGDWTLRVMTFPQAAMWSDIVPTLSRLCPTCGRLPEPAQTYRDAVEWLVILTAALTSTDRPFWLAPIVEAVRQQGALITPPGLETWPEELVPFAQDVAGQLELV